MGELNGGGELCKCLPTLTGEDSVWLPDENAYATSNCLKVPCPIGSIGDGGSDPCVCPEGFLTPSPGDSRPPNKIQWVPTWNNYFGSCSICDLATHFPVIDGDVITCLRRGTCTDTNNNNEAIV